MSDPRSEFERHFDTCQLCRSGWCRNARYLHDFGQVPRTEAAASRRQQIEAIVSFHCVAGSYDGCQRDHKDGTLTLCASCGGMADKLEALVRAASPDPPPPVDLEVNAWRELGEEIRRVIDLMPKEQFEDWFPDWFGPRLSELQMLAKASVSHLHVPSSSDDAICGVCGGWPDDPSHTLVHVQAVLHGSAMQVAARIAGPTAGDLLIRAVDHAMQHGMSCTLEDCPTCDAGFNQIRLAYKVWANSAYVRESRIVNTNLDHHQIREAFVRHLQQCPQCHDVILAAAAPQRQEPPTP